MAVQVVRAVHGLAGEGGYTVRAVREWARLVISGAAYLDTSVAQEELHPAQCSALRTKVSGTSQCAALPGRPVCRRWSLVVVSVVLCVW